MNPKLSKEQEALSQKCIAQLTVWHEVSYIRSEQETREWLEREGVKEPETSRILTGFGF